MLEIKNITKKYGKIKALDDFSVTLTEGVYGLIGPNGAGKTTLISIITRNLLQNEGSVIYDGTDIERLGKDYLKKIGYLPQYPKFYPDFSVWDFLEYIAVMKNIPKSRHKERIEKVLETVNLKDFAKMKIGKFSGGMRQRLGIAQAIINEPEILILDEPTAGLDPQERIRFRNLISKLSEGRIVLLSTHIVTDVECIAKEVLLINKGKLIAQKTPIELADSISRNVWTQDIEPDRISEVMGKYLISNTVYKENMYTVRIVSENKPFVASVNAPATLEDVYLWHFGEL